jgi:phage tail sheath gpL-like
MSSKNVSFSTIPNGILKPGSYWEFNLKSAAKALPSNSYNVILVGQRTSAGLVPQLVPTQLFSSDDAAAFFGAGSILHLMAIEAIATNRYLNLFAVANDDAAGSAARQETLTFTLDTLKPGIVLVYIGDQYVQYSYAATDTVASIATAIKNAVNALTSLPFTATSDQGVVTFTAKNKGTVAEQIPFEASVTSLSGLTAVFAQTVPGTGDPDIHAAGNVLDVITAVQYKIGACSYNDSTTLGYVKAFLNLVSGPLEQRPSRWWAGLSDSVANAVILGTAVGNGRVYVAHVKESRTPAFQYAAGCAAACAAIGDPALPPCGAQLPAMVAPKAQNRSSRTEQETLMLNGITPLEAGEGDVMEIVRAVSTCSADTAQRDWTTFGILDYTRLCVNTMKKTKYTPGKLRDGSDTKLSTCEAFEEDVYKVLLDLDDLDILENVAANRDGIIAEKDLQNAGQMSVRVPTDIIKGLYVVAGVLDLI